MIKTPLVSIVIPIYNVEKYLERCLISILEQTYNNIEVICVNDGSPDESQYIVNKYTNDSRVISIVQENKGLSGARNIGLEYVSGEYVMFVDSDDWLYANCVQRAIDEVLLNNLDVVIWPYTKVFENRKEKQLVYKDTISWLTKDSVVNGFYKDLIGPSGELLSIPHTFNSRVTVHSKLYKTSIVSNVKFVDIKFIGTSEDLLFNVEVFKRVNSCKFINEELYYYNKVNESSLTSTYKPKLIKQWDELHNRLDKLIYSNEIVRSNLINRYAVSIIGLGLNVMSANKSFFWSRSEIHKIIINKRYKEALSVLPIENMPLHWKVFFIFARNKIITPLTLLLLFIYRVILK